MTDTAAMQLRRILRVIPEISDGSEHDLKKIAKKAGVDEQVLLADLKCLADRQGEPGGFIEGMQVYISPGTVSVTSDLFLRPMGLTVAELSALELGLAILRSERPPDETPAIERARDRLRKMIRTLPADDTTIDRRFAERPQGRYITIGNDGTLLAENRALDRRA